jgi:glycosyltransferase involved in cell wall biosynthesis
MMYTIAPFKGADVAFEAFRLAREERPDMRLVVFGIDDAEADDHFPGDGAVFESMPAQDRLRGLYASGDAYLFASRSEGFGLPLLEAMACRTPVIATPAGAGPELVEEGGGILVGHEDAKGMARAMLKIAAMPSPEWRALSDKAHAVASIHSWERATDEFERALERAASGSKTGVSQPA